MKDSGAADAEEIRHRAYVLWHEDGCPEGRAMDYWLRAEAELNGVPAGGEAVAHAADEPPVQAKRAPGRKAADKPAPAPPPLPAAEAKPQRRTRSKPAS